MTASDPTARAGALADALREHLTRVPAWHFDSTGRSMWPTIPPGSRLAIEALPPALAPGDLLAFVLPGRNQVCCHRVIAVRDDGAAHTRGDNNQRGSDGWVEPALHVGVVHRYRTGGRWFDARSAERPGRVRLGLQRIERAGKRVYESVRARDLSALRSLGRALRAGHFAVRRIG